MKWTKTLTLSTFSLVFALGLAGCGTSGSAQRSSQQASAGGVDAAPDQPEEAQQELKRREVVAIEIKYVPDVTEKAQNIFQKALILVYEASPDSTADELAERYKEAADLFQDAIDEDAGFLEAYFNLGNIHHDLGRYLDALEHYRVAVGINPGYADAQFYLAVTLEKIGHSAEAKAHWRSYCDLAPDGEWVELAKEFSE